MTPWELHGYELGNCNCAPGCPCQFMSLPTYGNCEAVAGFEFHSGHHGETDLSGTRAAMLLHWPGPIHEGGGTMQVVIDDGASPAQRRALERIFVGEDTEDMATMWWVFSAMSPNKLQTLYKPIAFELDMESRSAQLSVPGVVDCVAEPITNPVTGAAHRARINLPHGFEYRVAEIARGTASTSGEIRLENNKASHAHLLEIHLSGQGVLEAP